MKVLITGNLGYIGSVLTKLLLNKGYDVTGLDIGYYKENLVQKVDNLKKQINLDIRDIKEEHLIGVDSIIHLASLSNDPLGAFNPNLTNEINKLATINLAQKAKKVGVKRFIYASSQSMYGISNTKEELDEDTSKKNPITAYAKSKWESEQEIKKIISDNFVVCSFRPSTVFGPSPRFRSDILYNNLMGCSFTSNKIEIFSDGTPIRPTVHIEDVCSALIAGLIAPGNIINGESFNIGVENGNYTVHQIAKETQKKNKDSKIIFTGKYGKDERTYRVSFKKIYRVLGDYYKPKWNIDNGGYDLIKFFQKINFDNEKFTSRKTNRIKQLQYLSETKILDSQLKFNV